MEIDWEKVISNKTVLVWDAGHGFQDTEFHIVCVDGDSVWFRTNGRGVPLTGHKSDFKNCHIKSEWREITEECEFVWSGDRLCVTYKMELLEFGDFHGPNRKFKLEGRRVFTK